jgi:hypothetical protein
MANYKDTTLQVLTIRVRPQHVERLAELKRETGLSIQELVRNCLDRGLWPIATPEAELVQMPKTGVNSPKSPAPARRKVAYR